MRRQLFALVGTVGVLLGVVGCRGPSGTTTIGVEVNCFLEVGGSFNNANRYVLEVSLSAPEWVDRGSTAPLEATLRNFHYPDVIIPPGPTSSVERAVAQATPSGWGVATLSVTTTGLEDFSTTVFDDTYTNGFAVPVSYDLPEDFGSVSGRLLDEGPDPAVIRFDQLRVVINPGGPEVTVTCLPTDDNQPSRLAVIDVGRPAD